MNDEQKRWFLLLTKDREDSAKTLEKPSMRGIKNSVVEKYSDQAHFIYELLQNANDAKATKAYFLLKEDGLFFRHNGSIHFCVSNPETEDDDKENNRLGHINSITSIANSNKTESSIGKFGVGFKAVFQYTDTPYIYDRDFQFKIEKFIVPVRIDEDLADCEKEETVFYFPFNKKEMPADNAFSDILGKLKKLTFPTLFLTELQEVCWKSVNEQGTYLKEVVNIEFDSITCEKINLLQEVNSESSEETILLFSREYDLHRYSVGFFIGEKEKLIPKTCYAFCYFPTHEVTNLNFILHAPFLLTDSREGIKRSEKHNIEMVEILSQLAADSMLVLKEMKLIDDDIFKIVPYKIPEEDNFFGRFYHTLKQKFETEEILPTKDGNYAQKKSSCWAAVPKLTEIFSDEQLSDILGERNICKWVFCSKGREETSRIDKELSDYIESITNNWLNEKDILNGNSLSGDEKHDGVTSNFIEKQNDEWVIGFYRWIADTEGRMTLAKGKPFFLNQERKAISIIDENNKLQLFLPDSDGEGYDTLNADIFNKMDSILKEELLKGKNKQQTDAGNESPVFDFFKKFGIREHTVADDIDVSIERFKSNTLSAEILFNKLFKYYKNECKQENTDEFINKIKYLEFIPFFCKNKKIGFSVGCSLYYPTDKLVEFYKQKKDIKFVNIIKLYEKYSDSDRKNLDDFIKKLGVIHQDPSLKDRVYNIILPKYKFNKKHYIDECCKDLKILMEYYQECPNNEIINYLSKLQQLNLLLLFKINDCETKYIGKPDELYYPSADLIEYFSAKADTMFVALEDYHKVIRDKQEQQKLKEFLLLIGVCSEVRVTKQKPDEFTNYIIYQNFHGWHRRGLNGFDKYIVVDGLNEALNEISVEKSKYIWEKIVIPNKDCIYGVIEEATKKDYSNLKILREYSDKFGKLLRESNWLYTNQGQNVAPHMISIDELAQGYKKDNDIEMLFGFKPSENLTLSERIAELFGDNEEEAKEAKLALEEKRHKEKMSGANITNNNRSRNEDSTDLTPDTDSIVNKTINDLNDLQKELSTQTDIPKKEKKASENLDDQNFDENEAFIKEVENLKNQLEMKKNRTDLAAIINNSKKYSFEWFMSYLQLLITYKEKQDSTTQKTITFQEIKPYKKDGKYYLLRGSSCYISSDIENADDFNISLYFKNNRKENVKIEGVSKKGQDLLIYCPAGFPATIISAISSIYKIEIKFTPVIDLLDRLYRAFTNEKIIDSWEDINNSMPPLSFIYGPPGTGKTTNLCNKICNNIKEKPRTKILVLTPTNKAADVVCKKIKIINPNVYAIRLSSPTDPDLEKEDIYREVIDENDIDKINVVVSTIHRLPYFEIHNTCLLFEYGWDYVIFDEASMIGLHYITFAIMALQRYNSDTKIIIAGDPKQIPPVIEIDDSELENFDFQDENIYKMMNLESFKPDEQIMREIDTIENLTIQYRSVPHIGQLYSDFSYSGLLIHDREDKPGNAKILPEKFQNIISSRVTFLDFPLNQENSIYKVNKLIYSSYQTYSAILIAEIIKYFDNVNCDEEWTIGLIAPYKAQAVLLNKLIISYGISDKLKVYADTVHGFQGDECDVVFFLCNPNNYFYSGHKKALLSKEYIYNVAISRARDYLVILHPYSEIVNNPFIGKIGISYKHHFGNERILAAREIEKKIFDNECFIENNSYVSGHDNINIFGISEMKYFIKSSDNAIDIQLRHLDKEIE